MIENANAKGCLTRSSSERPRGTDAWYKTIVFKGIPSTLNAEQRIREIESFMATQFPNIRVRDIGSFYKGPFPNGRAVTNCAYAELSNADVRREVLEKISSKDKMKMKCGLAVLRCRVKKL